MSGFGGTAAREQLACGDAAGGSQTTSPGVMNASLLPALSCPLSQERDQVPTWAEVPVPRAVYCPCSLLPAVAQEVA